jgi:hypothetical protein
MNASMDEGTAITLFSLGMASTFTVLFFGFRRTYRLERERALMKNMRRRLYQIMVNRSS